MGMSDYGEYLEWKYAEQRRLRAELAEIERALAAGQLMTPLADALRKTLRKLTRELEIALMVD